jgi:hypothetical protein
LAGCHLGHYSLRLIVIPIRTPVCGFGTVGAASPFKIAVTPICEPSQIDVFVDELIA